MTTITIMTIMTGCDEYYTLAMADPDIQIGVGGGRGGGLRASVWSKNKGGLALPLDPPLISDVNDTLSSG